MRPGVTQLEGHTLTHTLIRRELKRAVVAQAVGHLIRDVGHQRPDADERTAARSRSRARYRLVQVEWRAEPAAEVADKRRLHDGLPGSDFVLNHQVVLLRIA